MLVVTKPTNFCYRICYKSEAIDFFRFRLICIYLITCPNTVGVEKYWYFEQQFIQQVGWQMTNSMKKLEAKIRHNKKENWQLSSKIETKNSKATWNWKLM